MRDKLEKTLFNVFGLKIAAVVLFFGLNLSVLKTTMDGLVKVVLLWGAAVFLYDLFARRKALKGRGALFLWLFFLFYAVSVVLNINPHIKNEISLYGYMLVALLLFYPVPEDSEAELLRQLRTLTWVYIALTAAACTVSLVIFSIRFDTTFVYGGIDYYVGVYEHRLWGIFSNPNSPTVLNGVVLTILQFTLLREKPRTVGRRWQRAALIYTLAVSLMVMILAQSNGLLISLGAFVFLMAGYACIRFLRGKGKRWLPAIVCSLLTAVFSVTALWALFEYGRVGLSYLPTLVDRVESLGDADSVIEKPVDLERDPDKDGSSEMTGRPEIWKQGIGVFLQKPLFGNGSSRFSDGLYWHGRQLLHFHNIVVQALASSGLAGTLMLGVFGVYGVICLVRGRRRFSSPTVTVLGAFLVMVLMDNMGEVTLLFRADLSLFVFWIYFGYLMALVGRKQPLSAPDRLVGRLADRFGRRGERRSDEEETA